MSFFDIRYDFAEISDGLVVMLDLIVMIEESIDWVMVLVIITVVAKAVVIDDWHDISTGWIVIVGWDWWLDNGD